MPEPSTPSPSTARPWLTGRATTRDLIRHAESVVGSRYRIETLAGQGGMGRVFAARETTLARPVAIKLLTLPPPLTPDEPFDSQTSRSNDRLIAEARAMAALDHPALCKVIEVALDEPVPFLVMEWAHGEPLDRAAARLTTKARLTLLLRVIDAIAHMHDQGLIHGDCKPANIIVDQKGNPVIVDFGLARAEADSNTTPCAGSPGYAAPEQLLGTTTTPQHIGPEADVFALGVLLYELLTERSPFPRNAAPAVVVDLLERGGLPLPEDIAPTTPADLQKICLAAMERDPSRRYKDAGALAADIRRYLRRETVAARPSLLTDRIADEVEHQIARTAEWHRLGMISKRDAENAARVLRALPHAESPWIVDARRLRGSQAALVAGGWTLTLAIALGLTTAPLHPLPGSLIAWTAALATLILGLRLHRSGQKRLGLGMLATAQLAVPAATWVTLKSTGWLTNLTPNPDISPLRLANLYAGEPTTFTAITDTHALIVSGVAALLATALFLLTRRALFTIALAVSLAIHWPLEVLLTRAVADAGLIGLRDILHPSAFAFLLAIAWPLVLLQIHTGPPRTPQPDQSSPGERLSAILAQAAGLAAGLALLTALYPGTYLGQPTREPTPALTAYASFINALILTAALLPSFRRANQPVNRSVAAVARWVLPTHLMLPLVFMDIHETFGVRTPWLIALGLASIAFTAASALHQWRPFLLAGLAFVAVWFVRTLDALPPTGDLILTLAALAVGLALMLAAWRAPTYLADRRLARWTRTADARPDPRSRRTWR